MEKRYAGHGSCTQTLYLAFRGHNSNLHETNNGHFLGVVELLEEFDPVMSEHVRRAETKEIADHYLGKTIQNELITLIGDKTVEAIIQGVKQSHYYSVIMDCTPDAAHIEQLSVTLRFVKCHIGAGATVEEHFVGFLPVLDACRRTANRCLLEAFGEVRPGCRKMQGTVV